jgi:hypothetical protein
MSDYKIITKRVVFNADFKHKRDFFEKKLSLMKEFEPDFPGYQVSGVDFFALDRENHFSQHFTHKKLIFEYDEANSKKNLIKEKISNALNIYNKYLSVEKFIRLGVRSFNFIELKDIKVEELADVLYSKLYQTNESLLQIFPEKISDLAYVLDYKKDGFLYHLKCGPMPKDQVGGWIDFGDVKKRFSSEEEFKEYFNSFPGIGVFLDVDCYKEDVLFDSKDEYLTGAFENIQNTCVTLRKYLFE